MGQRRDQENRRDTRSTGQERRARVLPRLLLVLLCLGSLLVLGFWTLVLFVERGQPEIDGFDGYRNNVRQVSRMYAADGTLVTEWFDERRTFVCPRSLPSHVRGAVVVAEDTDFYRHPGIDLFGIARAMWVNLWAGRVRQGGSTITQQVAKTFFLTPERTLRRKLEELVLARNLERRLTKEEILGLYLNHIYFGHGRYGVEEAAQFYFSRPARDLDPVQAATLAAIIPAPEALSPVRWPGRVRRRRDAILLRMEREGVLPPGEGARLARTSVSVGGRAATTVGLGEYYAAAVLRELERQLGRARVYRGGLRVMSAMELPLQLEAERAVREGLAELDRKYGYAPPSEQIAAREMAARRSALAGAQPQPGRAPGRVLTGIVVASSSPSREAGADDGVAQYEVDVGGLIGCLPVSEEERYRQAGAAEGTLYEPGAVLRVALRLPLEDVPEGTCPPLNLEQGPQAALLVLANESGRVLAHVGGNDPLARPFDRALQARRQMGSTFKPIVFAAALATGAVSPQERFENRVFSYRGAGGKRWAPRNHGGQHDGALVTLRESLARSLNVVAVQVLRAVGLDATLALARELGFSGALPRDLSLALGSGEGSLLELVSAYRAFTGAGYRSPVFITRVLDSEGHELFRTGSAPSRHVLSSEVSALVRRMLVAAVDEGTARGARIEGVEVWGKTGTTDRSVDAWFVGGFRGYTVGLWVGFDDRRPLEGSAGQIAVPIWAAFARAVLALP